MGDLGPGEQHRGAIRAGRHARATADADRGVDRLLRVLGRDRVGVRLGLGSGVHPRVAAGLLDPVQGRAVDDQVPDHGEGGGAEGLDRDRRAIVELAHVDLAGRSPAAGAVRAPVDRHRAGAADALAAIVVERDRGGAFDDQPVVERVHHLEERLVGFDVGDLVRLEPSGRVVLFLAPDAQGEVHR